MLTRISKLKLLWTTYVLSMVVVTLMWPVGTWLQCREKKFSGGEVDAVYLVAGAEHQERRLSAVAEYIKSVSDVDHVRFLVGWDAQKGKWNRVWQKNLLMHDLAALRIEEFCKTQGFANVDITIVPGMFTGTDGEMEVLSQYLKDNSDISSLVIVTSPFHARRALWRLECYADGVLQVSVMCPEVGWFDRAPWVVVLELGKMVRDHLGLSRVWLLSRERGAVWGVSGLDSEQ